MAINKDLKNITTNLKGALTDAQPAIEKIGNTIGNTVSTIASNVKDLSTIFLDIGKAKRAIRFVPVWAPSILKPVKLVLS